MKRYRSRFSQNTKANSDRWLVSYADYMTLMFALFVVLYATAIIKEEPFKVLSESIEQIFKIKPTEGTGKDGAEVHNVEKSLPKQQVANAPLEQDLQAVSHGELNEVTQSDRPLGKPLQELSHELNSSLHQVIEQGIAKLQLDPDWLTVELSSGLLFASGSATASNSAEVLLEHISSTLGKVDNLIEVRGYSDNLAINNEIFQSNWQLSAARAASITNLLNQYGVIKPRLAIKAFGENQPVASNDTSQGRAQNRRVVIALSKYAYQQIAVESSDKKLLPQQVSDKITQAVEDYDEIQVIKLPNGGIRITTRKEQNQQN